MLQVNVSPSILSSVYSIRGNDHDGKERDGGKRHAGVFFNESTVIMIGYVCVSLCVWMYRTYALREHVIH